MTGASSWGLSTAVDDWRTRGLCTVGNPARWAVSAGPGARAAVDEAVEICGRCPVRVKCRDDHLANGDRNGGVIAGGWVFYATGHPRPFEGDEHLAPKRRPQQSPKASPDRAKTRRYLDAGRAMLAGVPVDDAAAASGFAVSTVRQAASLVRYSTPETLARIERGELSIAAATTALRRSGAARRGGRR